MEMLQQLTTIQQLNDVLEYSKENAVLLFKHSTTCPISANAYQELQQFSRTDAANDVKIAIVYVIEDRPVSNEIAEQLQIKHESPQAIFLKNGQVLWHASHWKITEDALVKAKQLAK